MNQTFDIEELGYIVLENNKLELDGAMEHHFSTFEDRRVAWELLKRHLPDLQLTEETLDEKDRESAKGTPYGEYTKLCALHTPDGEHPCGSEYLELRIWYRDGEQTAEELERERKEKMREEWERKQEERKKRISLGLEEDLPF